MKKPAWIGGAIAFALAGAVALAGDKDKDRSAPESPLEHHEARALFDKLQKRMDSEAWADAFAAVREVLDKHVDKLVLVEEGEGDGGRGPALHVLAGPALRRKLGTLPPEGVLEFRKTFGDDAQRRLDAVRASTDASALADVGDRYFPLEAGGEALLLAGDRDVEAGSLVGAALAWRSVLSWHPDASLQLRAAKRLVALLPLLGEATTASDLAAAIDASKLKDEDKAPLVERAKELAKELSDREIPDFGVDASGGIVPVSSVAMPSGKTAFEVSLPKVPSGFDWRNETPDRNDWQRQFVNVRRLLTGHAANDDYLFVHLGKVIFAYHATAVDYESEDGSTEHVDAGDFAWSIGGGHRGLQAWFEKLKASAAIPRFGMLVHGRYAYATLRDEDVDGFVRGRIVKFNVDSGKWLKTWGPEDPEVPTPRKEKDKDKADEQPEVLLLSFVGRPIWGGDRIYCGATNAKAPNETYAVALDRLSGRILWKRPLASSAPFNAQTNPWQAVLPRVIPAPSLALHAGALVALSNNGVVSAFDARDGRVLWARTYERDEEKQGAANPWRRNPQEMAESLGRGLNPVVAWDDLVLVVPTDSKDMYVVRASDGQLLERHGRASYRHLIGCAGGKVIFTGEDANRKGAIGAYHLKRGRRSLSLDLQWSGGFGRYVESGRGVVTGGYAYVPVAGVPANQGALVAFRMRDGKKSTVFAWEDAKKQAGDLVLGGDRLYTVGARFAHAWKEEE